MRNNNFALRLPNSLMSSLRHAAEEDGVAMNQYITVAVAEKLATRTTAKEFLAARAGHSSPSRALSILDKAGKDVAEI